jgi:hypothetical protein
MIGMAIKMTSDPFTIRGKLKHEVELQTGQSGADFSVLEIDQQLDTLSREILVIHEVDFDVYGDEFLQGVLARNNGSVDPAVQYANCAVNIALTGENDIETAMLSDPAFIAGRQLSTVAGFSSNWDNTPDTASYGSTGSKHPLAIVADGRMYLFCSASWNGVDNATAQTAGLMVSTRIMCQRAKADSDTYAALLTGAYNG